MQIQEFNLEIKNDKIKSYRVITFIIVMLNIIFLASSLFYSGQTKNALVSLAFILLYAAYRLYKSKKDNHPFYFDEWIYFLLMLLWANNYLIAVICLILFLLYTISIQKIIYNFDASGIKQKNFPWKKYEWEALSNVILKDNMLTLDFKNNRILQGEIVNVDISENQFNTFVKKRFSEKR